MGWQIKEQRGNSTRREFSLSLFLSLLPPLIPFLLFPLFFLSSSVCSLCNVFPLVPIALFHPIPSPHVHPPPPRRLSFCATLRGSTIFWLEKRPVLHKPEKWKKKGGKDCETRQAKKRIRWFYVSFIRLSLSTFFVHEILSSFLLPFLLPVILSLLSDLWRNNRRIANSS